jgi:hypothetical protein
MAVSSSPLTFSFDFSRSGPKPEFAREWLFYAITVCIRRASRRFVIVSARAAQLIFWNDSKHSNAGQSVKFRASFAIKAASNESNRNFDVVQNPRFIPVFVPPDSSRLLCRSLRFRPPTN